MTLEQVKIWQKEQQPVWDNRFVQVNIFNIFWGHDQLLRDKNYILKSNSASF